MLKVGIVGLGTIAKKHIKVIDNINGAQLVAGCDIDCSKRVSIPRNSKFYERLEDMLDQEELDIVHICLPHNLHYEVTKLVAYKGYDIVLEKPLSHNIEDAIAMLDLEKNYGVRILVCLQNRMNNTVRELKRILTNDSENYGEIQNIRAVLSWNRNEDYFNSSPWRGEKKIAGGGVFINQAIHTIDIVNHLMADDILEIKSFTGNLLNFEGVEVEDSGFAKIDYIKGKSALLMFTNADFETRSVSFNIKTTRGKFDINEGILSWKNKFDQSCILVRDVRSNGEKNYYGNGHYELIRSFYFESGKKYINPTDAFESMKIIDKIYNNNVVREQERSLY